MKITISRYQWEAMGKQAGWIKGSGNGMMPGQTPYTPEELNTLHKMVGDAAEGDQGEAFDKENSDDMTSRRRSIRVTMSDGDVIETEINGTKKEIIDYYKKNEFVKADEKTMHHGVKIQFLE